MTRAWRKWSGGRRRVLAAAVTMVAAGGLTLAAEPAQAASSCVGSGGGCYPTIQAAVDAAHAGDTITIGAGTFAGGVTITKSVHLQGAGAASTIIRGGDHVLTIGAYGAASEPTVSISGVTVTGGLARSSPESIPLFGKAGVWATGGGIEIPPGANLAVGATVTITDSVINTDPAMSTPCRMPRPTLSTSRMEPAINVAMPTGTFTKKIQCQLSACVRMPPARSPMEPPPTATNT